MYELVQSLVRAHGSYESYKDQLKKMHAEAEAARKRGVELAEPHKAALEQNKQVSKGNKTIKSAVLELKRGKR